MGSKGSTDQRTTADGHLHADRRAARRRGRRSPARPGRAATAVPEPLECRLLYTLAATTAVTITWNGYPVQAEQNQYLISTRNPVKFQALAAREGFANLTSLGGNGMYEFTSTQPVANLDHLSHQSGLGFTTLQPNLVKSVESTSVNDPLLSEEWGLHNTGQLESWDYNNNGVITPYNAQAFPGGLPADGYATSAFPSPPNLNENQYGVAGDDVDAQQAWDITEGSKNVVVADLDTGLDITNPDIIPNLFTNPLDTAANNYDGDGYPGDIHGYDTADNDAVIDDPVGHGTNTAGIMAAAGDNGLGVSGVAPHTTLLPVKVGDDAGNLTEAGILGGINYCIALKDHGIDIVAMNESLGGTEFPVDVLERDATAQAGKAGILDVVSAGNSSADLDRTADYPAKYSNILSNVITVAAVDNQFKIAAFSNYGAQTVDLGAPGVNILSTTPMTTAFTDYTTVTSPYDRMPTSNVYGWESGTSQAAPMVTGILALEAAANPSATAAQLKQALLKSVTYDPSLAAVNGQPALVRTSGVANAYGAVLAILNPFDGSNAVAGGTWTHYYGSQAAYVVGDSTANPSFATVTTVGGSPVVVSNNSGNVAALQRASDPSQRVLAYEGAATTETIQLAFTDGQSHQTSLYLVDADRKHRTETVSLVDPATGRTLDEEEVTKFTKGQYLTWTLQGNVDLVINSVGGGAAYSGLFFDAPATSPIANQGTDATTGGANWRNAYGSQGAFIAGDNNTGTLPAYVSGLNVVDGTLTTLHAVTRDARALQKQYDLQHNIEAYYSTATAMDVNVSLSDTATHVITLYVADYTNRRRAERVQAIDTATGAVLATQDLIGFGKGEFVSFRVNASVTFRITNQGGPDAVVSGVFFDAPFGANAHFDRTTTNLGGNWAAGTFGSTQAYVVGDNFPQLDTNAASSYVSITGASRGILATPTNDQRALYKTGVLAAAARVEAYAYTQSSMTIDYNPGDYLQHQLTLYFADYENDHRAESVTLFNATTNTVLTHQVLSNFSKGKYLTWDVTGPVLIVINNGTTPDAVFSGLFID